MAQKRFTHNPATTVSSGGTTAPAAGTSESWTAASSSGFPSVSSTDSPATSFLACDPAAASELFEVTKIAGTAWTVTRGAGGTTPVAHAGGFTVQLVVSAQWLEDISSQSLKTLSGLVAHYVAAGTYQVQLGVFYLAAAGTGAITFNLPPADSCPPGSFFACKQVSTGNNITFTPASGEKINGAASFVVNQSGWGREFYPTDLAGNVAGKGWFSF